MDAAVGAGRRRAAWERLAPLVAGATALLSAAFLAVWVALLLTVPSAVPADDTTGQLFLAIPLVTMGSIALLLSLRRPNNPVGWLLGLAIVLLNLLTLSSEYLYHWLYRPDLPDELVLPLAVMGSLGWSAGFTAILVITPLIFPDGQLLSRRWLPVIWLAAANVVAGVVSTALDPGLISDGHRQAANPIGLSGAHDLMVFINGAVFSIVLAALMVAGVISLGVRYRRAGPDLRRQLKWFIAAVTVAVATLMTALFLNFGPVGYLLIGIGFTTLPVSIAIAVLRYRLYDIDMVINRTVLFGTMAAFITLVYIAVVVVIGSLVGSGGRPNIFLSVLATAIVGVAFQPVFNRARHFANRLAYGKRATPYEVLAELSAHLVDTFASDELLPRMARTVAEATGATGVRVWLRAGAELRPAAAWPAGAAALVPVAVTGQLLPHIDGVSHALPVRHQGELLGAITLNKRAGEPLTPLEEKLVSDLAAQAGLMLQNVGLSTALQARMEELRASRQRLVTAQDAERRRIERNLHDGAQQNLIALKVKLGLLEMLTKKDPERAAALVTEVRGDADEALETLRDLARGIYPPLLADQGLIVALGSQARKAGLLVEVRGDGLGRYPPEVEAAVYFCCLEAMQNVGKYAQATRATVSISAPDGRVEFEVRDDGAGFDPATAPPGAGLTNMTDRLDALGGGLVVASSPGAGTTVAGWLPVGVTGVPYAVADSSLVNSPNRLPSVSSQLAK